jgi:uncharacterized damage-inducible protein DinB
MLYKYRSIMVILFSTLFALSFLYAHEEQKTGFCAEFMGQIQFVQGRLMDLQKAVPQHHYNWRPAEDIRSIGEVYLHTALANYYFIKFAGYELPSDIDIEVGQEKWQEQTSDKNEINKILERSFAELQTTAQKITEADLEKSVHAFGMDMSLRNLMVSSLNHMHEHLGQSIAYPRSNKITPPWTASTQ